MLHGPRSHPVVCLIALAASLLNLGAAAGGAVLCQGPVGQSSIELACDHEHCGAAVGAEHDHDSGDCRCSSCPCQDTPIAVDLAPPAKDDDAQASPRHSLAFVFGPRCDIDGRTARPFFLADRPRPASLRQLRSVVRIE